MAKEIPDERFEVNYKNCLNDEPLIAIALRANKCGKEGKEIDIVKTSVRFGDGINITFKFKQPSF